MAKITPRKEKVLVETEKVVGVNLDLSNEEAFFLLMILRRVGGNPDGLRGIGDRIAKELMTIFGDTYREDIFSPPSAFFVKENAVMPKYTLRD